MKKIALFVALVAISLSAMAKAMAKDGIMWRVSGNGLEAPTYILGSHHLAPGSFIDQVKGLREAVAGAKAVYGEVNKDELEGAQAMMMGYVMASPDSTLSRVLSPADYASVDSLLATLAGAPGVLAQMEMMKPALVSTQLSVLQLMAAHPEMQTQMAFDVAVMALPEAAGKPNVGLETAESQMQMLFGEPISVQAADLMDSVRNWDKQIALADKITAAFLAQDFDSLSALVQEEYDEDPARMERLLLARNRNWADKLVKVMPEGPLFVVVGAAHLCGDQGLVQLLRDRGYTVESL